jgi:hypothetical protein
VAKQTGDVGGNRSGSPIISALFPFFIYCYTLLYYFFDKLIFLHFSPRTSAQKQSGVHRDFAVIPQTRGNLLSSHVFIDINCKIFNALF